MTGTIVVSQLGSRMHYAVPRMLATAGDLERFYTDACAAKGWPRLAAALPRILQPAPVKRLLGRIPHGVPPERITAFAFLGFEAGLRRARAHSPTENTGALLWQGERFARLVARRGFDDASMLYAFTGEAFEQLVSARERGLTTVVEQPIAPRPIVDRLVAEEEGRFPHWQRPSAEDRLASEYAQRERAEWAASDLVICGSEFVRGGVLAQGGDPLRCRVVPYGVDASFSARARRRRRGRLRVLTAGNIGLRKGSPYVLAAARRLGAIAEFRMIGRFDGVLSAARKELAGTLDLVGPVPRAEVRIHYEWADVFLLPTICEGSATVTYEALMAGLPVITTPNAGSVVRDGIEGFIVPIRQIEPILWAIERLALDPDLLAELSGNAVSRGANYDLAEYGRRLRDGLRSLQEGRSPDPPLERPGHRIEATGAPARPMRATARLENLR